MADIASTELQLSAAELAAMTKWPAAVIEEFLSLTDGIREINQSMIIINNNVSTIVSMESQNRPQVQAIKRAETELQQQVYALAAIPGRLAALNKAVTARMKSLEQLMTAMQAQQAQMQAAVSSQSDQIDGLEQLHYA